MATASEPRVVRGEDAVLSREQSGWGMRHPGDVAGHILEVPTLGILDTDVTCALL